MKRYLLFVFDSYYPSGGWEDFHGSFDSVADAMGKATSTNAQVVDIETGKIVMSKLEDEPWERGDGKS